MPAALADWQSYNDIYGVTNNPHDLSRSPGGSSGGSSAALAVGYGALSIGSDIGGSLRVPAHFCGIFAHKPTFALAPPRGHSFPGAPPLPGSIDLSVIGPMARSASDLEVLLEAIVAPDDLEDGVGYRLELPPARHTRLADFRVLALDAHPLTATEACVRSTIGELASGLEKAGATVVRASELLPDMTSGARLYMRLLMATLAARFPAEAQERLRSAAAALDPCGREFRRRTASRRRLLVPGMDCRQRQTHRRARALAGAVRHIRRCDLSCDADARLSA